MLAEHSVLLEKLPQDVLCALHPRHVPTNTNESPWSPVWEAGVPAHTNCGQRKRVEIQGTTAVLAVLPCMDTTRVKALAEPSACWCKMGRMQCSIISGRRSLQAGD